MNRRLVSALGVMLFIVLALPLAAAPPAAQPCEKIASLKLQNTTIISAVAEAEGPLVQEGRAQDGGEPAPQAARGRGPQPAPVLPAFCRVRITVAPAIKMEVWMPTSGWNGDFEGVGNGGKAGSISYPAMSTALKAGYATASTDTGHEGNGETWALGHPDLVVDFAYRAIHEMSATAPKVIAAFYGAGPRFSYFNGCSTGGRQGLMEAQRYPDDYNGILSGDPVIYYTHIQAGFPVWVSLQALKDPETYIPPSKLPALNDASVAACDSVDGLKDGLIADPRKCGFTKDPSVLLCKGADSPTCLTAKQLKTLKTLYSGIQDANGKEIYPGTMPGHETGWSFIGAADPAKAVGDNAAAGLIGFLKNAVFENPNWDYRTWSYEKDMPFADKKLASVINTTDPNIKGFQAHGGKLLLYHGWTDPTISPLETINYYKSAVADVTGTHPADVAQENETTFLQRVEQTADFIRLFMIPGMDHCGGGPGPNHFDAFSSLVNWVEHKQAPEKIIASHTTNNGTVDRTRPLCPFPNTAQYTGQGSTDDAANFVCKMPTSN
jgi:feruloyl esterase